MGIFPHSLGKADNSYGLLSLPSVYCYATATFTALICIMLFLAHLPSVKLRKLGLSNVLAIRRGPTTTHGALGWLFNSGSGYSNNQYGGRGDGGGSPFIGANSAILVSSCIFFSLPLPALLWEYLKSVVRGGGAVAGGGATATATGAMLAVLSHKHSYGIYWAALASNAILCIVVRLSSLVREVQIARSSGSGSGSSGGSGSGSGSSGAVNATAMTALLPTTTSLCAVGSILTVIWAIIATIHAPVGHVDPLLSIPLASLVFLTTTKGVVIDKAPALLVSATISAIWWLILALNALLIEGVGEEPLPSDLIPTFGLFSDSVVSVWRAQAWWVPALNGFLMLMALPALYSSLVRHRNDSDDAVFVYTLISIVPFVSAQTASIRYLGLVGLIVGAWRCMEIGTARKRGNTLI